MLVQNYAVRPGQEVLPDSDWLEAVMDGDILSQCSAYRGSEPKANIHTGPFPSPYPVISRIMLCASR